MPARRTARDRFAPLTPPRTERQTLALPDGGGTVAVVADTHSHPHPQALSLIEALRPAAIVHAGDIGDLSVLGALGAIAPVIAVRGNIDGRSGPPDVVELTVTRGAATLRVLLTHIAVRGPRLRADARRLAEGFAADVVICGHSHVPLVARDAGFVVFNPGSIGPRRFALPIVFGVLDVKPTGVDLRHVDCETGERWRPPMAPVL